MASDIQKTIEIIFQGNDQVSQTMTAMSRNFDVFSNKVEDIAAPFGAIADSVLKLDAALIALSATGLAVAFNESVKFENSVIELKKVLDGGLGLQDSIDEAIRLSDVYGESASSILLSAADFKQAGFDINESLSLTKNSLDLVIAGGLEASQASELIVSALKGFGEGAEEASRFVDILNEVSNNYATDVEQLAVAMSKVSPIAEKMGFSMEETAGLVVPVIEVFRSGGEAAVALKTGLLKLIDDAKPVREALASIGVAQTDVNGELRSGKDIFIDVAKAFQTMDEKQKLFVTSQLVGLEQSARMVTVFDNLAGATEIANSALNSAGSAALEVAARLESAEVSVNRFKVGFQNLAVTVGDQFRLAAKEAIDGGTDIENALRGLITDGAFDQIFDELNDFSLDLGRLLSSIAKNLPQAFEGVNFDELLAALKDVGESVGIIFDDVDLTTPEGLSKVIQNVVDSLTSLANITDGMINAFQPFIENIVGLVSSFNDLDAAEQKQVGEILGLAKAVTDAGLKISLAILAIGGAADALAPTFKVIINLVSGSLDLVLIAWNGLKLAFIEIVSDLLSASLLLTNIPGLGGLEDDVNANIATLDRWKKAVESDMLAAADSATKNLTGIETDFKNTAKSADDAAEDIKKVPEELELIPSHKQTDINVEADEKSIRDTKTAIDNAAPDEIKTDALLEPDKASIENTGEVIEKAVPFEKTTEVIVKPDTASISKTKKAVDEIPENKLIEIELQGDIDIELARIKASAAAVQTVFEWKAKLDVANVEAQAKVAVAAFESVASSVDSTSQAASSMFSSLLDNWEKLTFASDRNRLIGLIQQQLNLEKEALAIQRELTDAQIEFMRAKTDALNSGDGLIQITSDGLEPSLEMIMWEIIQKVQIRVNEEAGEFLLGLNVPT